MKTALLIAFATLGLAGCATYDGDCDRPRYRHEYGACRGRPYDYDRGKPADHTLWKEWRYDHDPDLVAPRLPLDPMFPPSPTPPGPLLPG